ncbi:MAG: DUF2281 domain-containing protein [Runella slithyformis]|jgi:hypothetical protein|nr:MAG: DUF2281 domain-containing protein [Runella slithyformis]TAF94610.1 MAG: DUF2281 domain-containing protein [Runella sp.]TAG23924.1 MAG: DUF2281 domain-containing protein [Cytophagales bacterium]TAG34496.1 MAG: DUF2281 domain-containing protein [Cytophagia bacterium]TAF48569.1 MAG: DUF2281 domain-containing protein [Runella slithyformis]
MSLLDLVAKIEKLPPEKQVEVEDFVDFLASRKLVYAEKKPVFGSFKGKIEMADDFDEPLDDFKEYMYP